MRYLFFSLLSFYVSISFCQPSPEWSRSYDSGFDRSISRSAKIIADNNSDLVISSWKAIGSDSERHIHVITKYSQDGEQLWQHNHTDAIAKNLREYSSNYLNFQIDNLNNIYVAYSSDSSDSSAINTTLIKYNSSGSKLWEYKTRLPKNERFIGLQMDDASNMYLMCNHESDIVVTKVSSDGIQLWEKNLTLNYSSVFGGVNFSVIQNSLIIIGRSFRGSGDQYIHRFKMDTSGSVNRMELYYYRESLGANHIDQFGNLYVSFGPDEFYSYKLIKLDSAFNIEWEFTEPTTLPPSVYSDGIFEIVSDSLGQVYITGKNTDYRPGEEDNTDINALTIKFDSEGNELWRDLYTYQAGETSEIGTTICLDNQLNVYIGGSILRGKKYYSDYLILKYGPNGSRIGNIFYNGEKEGADLLSSLVYSNGYLYSAGFTYQALMHSYTTIQKYSDYWAMGLESSFILDKIIIYPNPSSGQFNITSTNPIYYIKVHSTLGELVYEENLSGQTSFVFSTPPSLIDGLYFITIQINKRLETRKLTLNRE